MHTTYPLQNPTPHLYSYTNQSPTQKKSANILEKRTLISKTLKASKVSLYVVGITLGTTLFVSGGTLGLAGMTHLYLNTELGVTIFKIFSAIFFPMGSALGLATGAFATTPITAAYVAPLFGASSVICFALPFSPLILGLMGALPGAKITRSSYNKAYTLLKA